MAELRVEGDELVLHLTPLEEVEGLHGELRVRVTLDGSAHDAWVVGCADPEQVAAEISHDLGGTLP